MRGFFCVKAFSKCCLEFICSYRILKNMAACMGLLRSFFNGALANRQWLTAKS